MNYGPFDTLMFCGLAKNNLKLSGLNEFIVRLFKWRVSTFQTWLQDFIQHPRKLLCNGFIWHPDVEHHDKKGYCLFNSCMSLYLCHFVSKTARKCFSIVVMQKVFSLNLINDVTDDSFELFNIIIFVSQAAHLMSTLMMNLTNMQENNAF